jgi:hypothetical protein
MGHNQSKMEFEKTLFSLRLLPPARQRRRRRPAKAKANLKHASSKAHSQYTALARKQDCRAF